jgi:uncharacterized alkaline shock family protein YloU
VGVLGASSGAISGIFSGKTESRSGVKVVEDETGAYAIEVRVSLAFGVELATVAYEIQTKIIENIAKMTSKGVSKVDVYIDKVEKPQEAKSVEAEPEAEAEKPEAESAEKPEGQ